MKTQTFRMGSNETTLSPRQRERLSNPLGSSQKDRSNHNGTSNSFHNSQLASIGDHSIHVFNLQGVQRTAQVQQARTMGGVGGGAANFNRTFNAKSYLKGNEMKAAAQKNRSPGKKIQIKDASKGEKG